MNAEHIRLARAVATRGLSLVELMVGIVVGLFVVAAASLLVSGQLSENRRLLVETQMQQDLRAAADIIGRELRRSGSKAADPARLVALPGRTVEQNDFLELTLASASDVSFEYEREVGVPLPGRFALENGIIRTRPGNATAMQDLTDGQAMSVTRFNVAVIDEPAQRLTCPRLCAGNTVSCWPTSTVRSFRIEIEAQSRIDPTIRRSVTTQVRQRNDAVQFAGTPPVACPLP
jgi:Tfp pilus assembly protein PilW